MVLNAAPQWSAGIALDHPEVLRIGCFGSHARGAAGVGSDLDLVMVVTKSDRPFPQRPLDYDTLSPPVPTELLVCTAAEWHSLLGETTRFNTTLQQETVWLLDRHPVTRRPPHPPVLRYARDRRTCAAPVASARACQRPRLQGSPSP
jgi:uncharacterized protein